jgi:proteasome accessory factor C
VYSPSPDDPRVTLRLAPDAAWVLESHPHESAESLPGGASRVVLAISEQAWLERLLLTLGPDVRVEGPDAFVDLAASAAARLSARYGGT